MRQVNLSIDGSKATPVGDIPADMLKATLDIHLSLITKIIHLSFENGCFLDNLKFTEVILIFKKNDDLDKGLPVFYLMCQRSLKEFFIAKLMRSCKINYELFF